MALHFLCNKIHLQSAQVGSFFNLLQGEIEESR
jgi:hypothetical protein